ncbi:fungal specific transcription factor domain-containing protein [Pochonia chlamydosporia 170]|uniref:Fungal specific transcription factor domain-containing protein n=1 Tax=Pochonia chlamydosporia 170 TaxID=1380566 RepID=A0A179FRP4_METCM|nr:fungal specific transcription factor domain-containing protein [Pochonia chlamydosporia 170]OAQ67801.2 fungal specific transcription factor domain-containing protein [Pochonia chlamydosporia 170]
MPLAKNPFITVIMPLAYTDHLFMSSILAAIAGNTTGMLRQHIRAAREFISHLLLRPKDVGVDAESLDLGLELYVYIHMVNPFTSYGPDSTRNALDVPLVTILDNLQTCCIFERMFDGCYSLFEFIPQVDELAKYRLREEYLFPGDSSASEVLVERFCELQQRIEGWNLKPPRSATQSEWDTMFVASEATRSSLLIYLQTALPELVVRRKEPQETIQEHVDRALRLINATVNSRYMTLTFWPTLVVGSCVVQDAQKNFKSQRSPEHR